MALALLVGSVPALWLTVSLTVALSLAAVAVIGAIGLLAFKVNHAVAMGSIVALLAFAAMESRSTLTHSTSWIGTVDVAPWVFELHIPTHPTWHISRQGNRYWRVDAEIRQAGWSKLETYPNSARVRVMGFEPHAAPHAGDLLRVTGRFRRNAELEPFGDFDYAAVLERMGLAGLLTVGGRDSLVKQGWEPLSWTRAMTPVRNWLLNHFAAGLPPDTMAMVQAMVLGEKGELSPELYAQFQATGTAHLLAVSGAHVGMLALVLWGLGRLIQLPRRLLAWLVLAILVMYLGVIGFPESANRAVVMYGILVPLRLSMDRAFTVRDGFLLTFLLFMLADPTSLSGLSFQLSYLGVAGILWITPVLTPRLKSLIDRVPWRWPRSVRWLLSATMSVIAVTLGASILVDPLVAYHFDTWTPISPITNLLAGLMASALIAVFVVSILLFALQDATGFGSWLVDFAMSLLSATTWTLDQWTALWSPLAWIRADSAPWGPQTLVASLALLLSVVWWSWRSRNTWLAWLRHGRLWLRDA